MEIAKINEYSYSYAEYLVSDGNRELRCVCNSVPLPNEIEPKVGMKVKKLYIFSYNDLIPIKKELKKEYSIVKTEKIGFQYKLTGNIYNKKRALIRVFNFIMSLEYFYPDGIDEYEDGEYVTIIADRIECELEL